jgi:hypothetical protein
MKVPVSPSRDLFDVADMANSPHIDSIGYADTLKARALARRETLDK